jgi:hypothetical protein
MWIQLMASADTGDTVTPQVIAAAITLVIGAALGVAAQYLFDRWCRTAADHELWAECLTQRLESQAAISAGSPIGFVVAGEPVGDPHITDVWIWAAGNKDVERAMFDGTNIVVHLGVPIVSDLTTPPNGNLGTTSITAAATGSMVLAPSMVRKNFTYHRRVITDGRPKVTFTNEVPNLETLTYLEELRTPPKSRTVLKAILRTLGTIGLVGAILTFVLALMKVPPFGDAAVLVTVVPTIGFAAAILGLGLPPMLDGVGRRANRARRVLRRSLSDALTWERENPFD